MSSEIEVVEELRAEAGAGGGGGGGEEPSEPLKNDVYTAAAYGDLEKLQRLVENDGYSVTEPDGGGYYALQWAALNNRTAAAQYIIEHGGDVNAADNTGQTAVHWSAVRGHIPVAELLLKEGARVDAADLYGYQVRNKPIEPPKKPERAPFFLPSIPSLSGEILFKPHAIAVDGEKNPKMQELTHNNQKMNLLSQFSLLLHSCAKTRDFSAFTDYIKGLPPSTLDVELRMLQIIDDEDMQTLDQRPEVQTIGLLLDYFIHELSCKNNFEFIQAVIKLFLKIHGETIRMHLSLQEKAKRLLEVQSLVWNRVDKMFQSARCMVTFLSNAQF